MTIFANQAGIPEELHWGKNILSSSGHDLFNAVMRDH